MLFGTPQDFHTLDAVEDKIGDQEVRTALLQSHQEGSPLLIRFGGVALFREQIDEPGAHLTIVVQDYNVRSPWVSYARHKALSFLPVLAEDGLCTASGLCHDRMRERQGHNESCFLPESTLDAYLSVMAADNLTANS